MTYAGAKQRTASAMKSTLHFPGGNVHPAFHSLAGELAQQGSAGPKVKGDAFQLSIANSLWGEKTQHFEPSFTKVLKDSYGAGLEQADFRNNAEAERVRINGWVEDETHAKIKDLLPPGELKSDTKLVLVNAIYFKASWSKAFEASATQKAKFTTLAGPKVDVDMMWSRRHAKVTSGPTYDAVALPYLGEDMELVAVAPKAGTFDAFERSLDATTFEQVYGKLESAEANIHLPKFKIAGASVKLKEALTKLGMGVAFSDGADFSGITGRSDTKISNVVHKAFIALDERGTEAAAATAVVMIGKTAIAPSAVVDVRFDRPFVFAIRHAPTGALLFLGRVANPKG
jgi:serpin B